MAVPELKDLKDGSIILVESGGNIFVFQRRDGWWCFTTKKNAKDDDWFDGVEYDVLVANL